MNRKLLSLSVLSLVIFGLASCSGLPPAKTGGSGGSGGGSGGGGGNTTRPLTVTLIAGGEFDQVSFTVLALSAQISSLALTPTTGSAIALPLPVTPYPVDFNRLTTDTAVLSVAAIPANTSFSSMTMGIQNISVTIANGPAAIGTCAANAVCEFTPAPSTATVTATLFPGNLTAGTDGNTNMYLTVSEQTDVIGNGSGLTVSFAGVNLGDVGSFSLPRKGSLTGGVDLVQDFTGVVSAVSSSSVTVINGFGVPLTAGLSGTILDVPQTSLCPTQTLAACVTKGAVVSVDASVASGGALTATEIDLLDTTLVDSVEGTVISPVPGSFSLVVTDKQSISGNAALTAANIGDIFALTLDPAATYMVDTKNLTTATSPIVPVNLFQSSADILRGQTLRLHVTTASGTQAAGNQALTANAVQLRFTRLTLNASPSSSSVLSVNQFNQVYQLTNPVQVQTYTGVTSYDNGITDNTGIGGIGTSNLVSIRALLLKSAIPFYATMVRDQ
jgi:hypothetical protein